MFTALVLALADTRLGRPDDRLAIVLAVDTSASVQQPQQEAQQAWVREVRALARPDDRVSVVEFGRWAAPSNPCSSPESRVLSPECLELVRAQGLAPLQDS